MPRSKKDEVNFEINLTKAKWEPKTLEECAQVVSRSFEADLPLKVIGPLVGTDHVKTWPLDTDKDIPVFIKEKSMLNEAFAEKVVRYNLPRGVFPKNWQPKKVKILAKGPKVAKYFGEDQCGERQVQISLKLFECGHFYLKQTLPGSGISPHWTIFEGTWVHTDRGLKMEYLIRYSWQVSRKPEFDLNIEAVPPGWSNNLSWSGESETQLNGNIPAVVGGEKWCWVEIYRDADSMEKTPARFNEDMDNSASWRDSSWQSVPKPKPLRSSDSAAAPETVSKGSEASDKATLHQRRETEEDGERLRSFSAPAAEQPRAAASARPGTSSSSASSSTAAAKQNEESEVPLYIALAIFVVLIGYFGWQQWVEKSAAWLADREAGEQW